MVWYELCLYLRGDEMRGGGEEWGRWMEVGERERDVSVGTMDGGRDGGTDRKGM